MPWKIRSLVEARQRFVQAALRGVHSVAKLCKQGGISRKTGFKWLARFRVHGGLGLHNRSRRPKRSPRRTKQRWIGALARVRRQHPYWGAKKIYAHLRREHPRTGLPKVRTITRWLQRLGLVGRRACRARRGPQMARPVLRMAQTPNEVWTVDFKGWFRTRNGQRVDPLTVRDLFSRYILGIALLRPHDKAVRQYFRGLFRRYGLPKVIRVDHGSPFAGDGALDLSRLSAWWLRLGVSVDFTRRGRPQDNGAHEQMHRVYKIELASPPATTPRGQQHRTTRWIDYYNYHRPHEAMAQQVPATRYRKSRRRYQPWLAQLTYRRTWPTRKVSTRGYIHWRGRARVIGRAFSEQRVGLKPIEPNIHEVYFGRYLIGLLVDTDPGGLRPARWSQSPPPTSQA